MSIGMIMVLRVRKIVIMIDLIFNEDDLDAGRTKLTNLSEIQANKKLVIAEVMSTAY